MSAFASYSKRLRFGERSAHGENKGPPLIRPDKHYRPDPTRAVYVQGDFNQALLDKLTPQIIRLQAKGRDPITVFIDSRGGSTQIGGMLQQLLAAPDQDNSPICHIITVATGRAASSAADLLSFGDYAVAYPHARVFYHGVRFTPDDPLTLERASAFAESLRWRNDLFAMGLAKRSVRRFMFRYAISKRKFEEFRNRTNQRTLNDLECFLGILRENLSQAAAGTIVRAEKRYRRYDDLVSRVLAKSERRKRFQNAKRPADFEEVVLKEVISAVARRNPAHDWTFQGAGLSQLSDDFLLLLEYMACYDSDDLQVVCDRWANFFLTKSEQGEITAIQDDDQKRTRRLEILKPRLRPAWLFFVALCHSLQEGEENDLTSLDACWLGLIDEVIGTDYPESLRSFVEWEPDPEPEPATVPELPPSGGLAAQA